MIQKEKALQNDCTSKPGGGSHEAPALAEELPAGDGFWGVSFLSVVATGEVPTHAPANNSNETQRREFVFFFLFSF